MLLLTKVKLVCFFLVISLLSLAAGQQRNDTIKRSFHGESSLSSYVTVTVPYEDTDLIARLGDELKTTTDSTLVISTPKSRRRKRISSSLITVLNRCLDRHLTLQFLGPFLIFTGIVGILNGPLFGVKALLFSIQFNIVFPTFVCFVTVSQTFFS